MSEHMYLKDDEMQLQLKYQVLCGLLKIVILSLYGCLPNHLAWLSIQPRSGPQPNPIVAVG